MVTKKYAAVLNNLKPLLLGAGAGFGVPVALYTAAKAGDLASSASDIEDSLEGLKKRTIPLAIGGSLLGGALGTGLTHKYLNRDKDKGVEQFAPEYTPQQLAMMMGKFNAAKEVYITELKKIAMSPAAKLTLGLMAAAPATYAGVKYGDDLVDAAAKPAEDELRKGKIMAGLANVALPAASVLGGMGIGAGTEYALDKFNSYKDAYKDLILKKIGE